MNAMETKKPIVDPRTRKIMGTPEGQKLTREALAGNPLSSRSRKVLQSLRQSSSHNQNPSK